MSLRVYLATAVLVLIVASHATAAVNDEPMKVRVVPAFPQLQWPDFVTGADEGHTQEPRPIILTGAGDGSNRIFVATEYGSIHAFPNDPAVQEMSTFLDIRDRVQYDPKQNEEGLLGLAFHPQFAKNGEFFVFYSAKPTKEKPHVSVLSRFHLMKDDPLRADPDSEEKILIFERPFWNHDGGTILFGPDGYLYIATGDGGAGYDPLMNGQNLNSILGKVLRIDVDHKDKGLAYAIPKDNPFVGEPKYARGEVWAYGLRNIWRMAFDKNTGMLWAADVGQDTWEEIDIIRKGGNFGWNLRESKHPHGPFGSEERADLIEPIWEYHHDVGKSITGGSVYRGKQVPELAGGYLYADYVTGQIWALWYDSEKQTVTANRSILPKGRPVLSFGEDDNGEVYVLEVDGGILKFASP